MAGSGTGPVSPGDVLDRLAGSLNVSVSLLDFWGFINVTDQREVCMALQMVYSHLVNATSNLNDSACDSLLKKTKPVGRACSRHPDDMAFTDVQVPQSSVIVLVLLFSAELLLSLLGNSLVLLIFTCVRHMRSVTNFFIVSLAASDLLMTLTAIPLNIAQVLTGFWQFGPAVCKLGPFITLLSVAASSLTLCCIAFDRYVAVLHPLHLSTMQNPRRAAMLMTLVWLLAVGSAVPFAYYQRLWRVCKKEGAACSQYCGMRAGQQWIHWLAYVVLLLVPVLLMGASYAIVICKLWLRQPVSQSVVSAESLRVQYKKKAIKMLFLVMLIFIGCWTPVLTFDLLGKLLHWTPAQGLVTLRYYLQVLAMSATCLNPMVYAIMHDKYRKFFRKTCCPSPATSRASRRVTPLAPGPSPGVVRTRPVQRPPTSTASCEDGDMSVVNEHCLDRVNIGPARQPA